MTDGAREGDGAGTVIGLEVHVQLRTVTKLFCRCRAAYGAEPGTRVCPVCLGLPGALPVPNQEAVRLGVRAAAALGCEVDPRSRFDRKNYFYPDLPKGYQITQYHQPLATGSAWIDRYALQQGDEFLRSLDSLNGLRCVVWGHIHHDFRAERDGVAMLGAPSTAVNSLPGMEQFTPDPKGPACRWLELAPDGAVHTGIRFVGGRSRPKEFFER